MTYSIDQTSEALAMRIHRRWPGVSSRTANALARGFAGHPRSTALEALARADDADLLVLRNVGSTMLAEFRAAQRAAGQETPMPEPPDAYDPLARRCGTCRYHDVLRLYEYYGKNAEGMGGIGFCRRVPPMPDFTRLIDHDRRAGEDATRLDVFVFDLWPETDEDDWCGEYREADLQDPIIQQQLGFVQS